MSPFWVVLVLVVGLSIAVNGTVLFVAARALRKLARANAETHRLNVMLSDLADDVRAGRKPTEGGAPHGRFG